MNKYSIEQFKRDYNRIINTNVLPILGQYEATRKRHIIKLIIDIIVKLGVILLCLFALYEFFQFMMYLKVHPGTFIIFEKPNFKLIPPNNLSDWVKDIGCLFGLIIIIWASILSCIDKKRELFEKEIKQTIIPLLLNKLQIFHLEENKNTTKKEITDSQLFYVEENAEIKLEECTVGEYNDYQITLTDITYNSKYYEDFTGTLIKIKLTQNTESTTIIRPEKAENEDLRNKKFEKFEINDKEFMDEYQIYTTDQLKANYLLNADFVGKLKNISESFCSGETYCSIKDDTIYIAIPGANGLFSIDSLFMPITNETQFQRISDEFVSILELVEYLHTKS